MINSNRIVKIDISKHTIEWDKKIVRGKNFGKFQFEVKQLLRPHWENHIVLEEFPVPAKIGERGKSIDFVNLTKRICLEADGRHHYKQVDYFAKNKYQLFKQWKRDDYKEHWAEINGFKFYRIYQDDVLNNELLKELGVM